MLIDVSTNADKMGGSLAAFVEAEQARPHTYYGVMLCMAWAESLYLPHRLPVRVTFEVERFPDNPEERYPGLKIERTDT